MPKQMKFDAFVILDLDIKGNVVHAFGMAAYSRGQNIKYFQGVLPSGQAYVQDGKRIKKIFSTTDNQSSVVIDEMLKALSAETKNPKSQVPQEYHRALGL